MNLTMNTGHIRRMSNYFVPALLAVIAFIAPLTAIASGWDNHMRIVNNYNQALVVSFLKHDTNINIDSNCTQKSITNYQLATDSASCDFTFTTTQSWLNRVNSGTIKVSLAADPNSYCLVTYKYNENLATADKFAQYSENITNVSCNGALTSNMLTVHSPSTEVAARPIAGSFGELVLNKFYAVSSFLEADCLGSKNCLILSPDANRNDYVTGGSSLAQAMTWQDMMDKYDTLNVAQFIGTHNSLISPAYTNPSGSNMSLSRIDPDNYVKISQELQEGLRMFEFDLASVNGKVFICHNHTQTALNDTLCGSNSLLVGPLTELNNFLNAHSDAVILLYIDANAGLETQIAQLDTLLSQLEPRIFTVKMAQDAFGVTGNTLPVSKLTKDNLVRQFGKNIIVVTNEFPSQFAASKYVFTQVSNSNSTPLYTFNAGTFINQASSLPASMSNYEAITTLFNKDIAHTNVLRINADRTIIGYSTSSPNAKDPTAYHDYITANNVRWFGRYPLNLMAMNMYGYACGNTACASHPTDPRLYGYLWSWQLGYPLLPTTANAANYAYIDTQTKHMANLNNAPITHVLCEISTNSTTLEKTWEILPYNQSKPLLGQGVAGTRLSAWQHLFDAANASCSAAGGVFSAPTTSYYMASVLDLAQADSISGNILVNYQFLNNAWVANNPQQ